MTATLCPGCLAELPEDYEFDHVAIDQALAGNIAVLARMERPERRELVTWGRQLGLGDSVIAVRVHRSVAEIQNWFTEPTQRGRRPLPIDDAVRELWEQGKSDREIAAQLAVAKTTVLKFRRRLGLPARFASGGVRKAIPA